MDELLLLRHDKNRKEAKTMAKLPKLLNAAEVAERLNLKTSQVYYMFKLEGFPITRLGERVYVDESKLIEWLNSHTAA